jgi:hypothetical protein
MSMARTDVRLKKITFFRLGKALTSLGFDCTQTDRFTAFRDTDHDALIILPVMEPSQEVDESHLVAVHNTVTGKGVATAEQLHSRLLGLGDVVPEAVERASRRPAGQLKRFGRHGRNR